MRSHWVTLGLVAIAIHLTGCGGGSGAQDAGRSDGRVDSGNASAVDTKLDSQLADATDVAMASDSGTDVGPNGADSGRDVATDSVDAVTAVDSSVDAPADSGPDLDSSIASGDAAEASGPQDGAADFSSIDATDASRPSDASDGRSQCIRPAGSRTLVFESQYLNLDTGTISMSSGPGPGDPSDSGWDIQIAYNGGRAVHSVVFHNQLHDQIAHLRVRTFSSVTSDDVAAASFQTGLIDEPFDNTRAILIRTDTGAVFAIGNPVETDTNVTFDTERIDFAGCADAGTN
jgi:hypothetical protein